MNNWSINISTSSVQHRETGETRRLGEYQLKLLVILAQNPGQIYTHKELTQLVWDDRVIGNNSLPNAIHALRLALGDDGRNQNIIKTVPRKGYTLIMDSISSEATSVATRETVNTEEPAEDTVPDDECTSEPATVDAVPLNSITTEETQQLLLSTVPVVKTRANRPSARFLLAVVLSVLGASSAIEWVSKRYLYEAPAIHKVMNHNYKNIQLYEIHLASETPGDNDEVQNRLQNTLSQLESMLKTRSAHMNVFFSEEHSNLNYSFEIINECSTRQLSLTFDNWKKTPKLISERIMNETVRKFKELKSCTST